MNFSTSPVPPKATGTPVPYPLPPPVYPPKLTSILPCDELSSLGYEDGEDATPVPDEILSTPRLVRKAVYSYVNPEDQSKNASILSWNDKLAKTIGVDPEKLKRSQWTDEEYENVVKMLTGGARSIPVDSYLTNENGPRISHPWSLCYGGHQFGFYAGQLGDGRAISLYETVNPETGEPWELQLKGAGKTPYSRFADGYAVLRSSIREYLCAEAVAALGVPSSRSLAITSTETAVLREEGDEPGSIVCRVAPSWIRFGNFEIFFYRKDRESLRRLADYVSKEVFQIPIDDPKEMEDFSREFKKVEPEGEIKEKSSEANAPEDKKPAAPKPVFRNRYAKMFEQIAHRTAVMVSGWQSIGFCHGVMNTDNMSVLGLTIDYGPYAFLDKYDPGWICNHSDSEGRYSFQQQPGICLWNLSKLALTLENLIGAQERVDDLEWLQEQENDAAKEVDLKNSAQDIVVDILNKSFREVFLKDYRIRMNAKLGLGGPEQVRKEDLTTILVPTLSWMDDYEVDFHQFFRELADYKVEKTENVEQNMEQVEALVKKLLTPVIWQARGSIAVEESKSWLEAYHARVVESDELRNDEARRSAMNRVNPAFVLRNWVAQKVIERVTESVTKPKAEGTEDPDKDLLDRVLWMCQNPFGGESAKSSVSTSDGDACEFKRNDAGLEAYEEFAGPVPDWGQGIQCSCSS
ncbi:hypothetical protein BGZ76_002548 [Entomortierella beljakovae]|nr:hypothetical protein BGZ76_002548 [Entomortierella beljakovae]